MSDTFSPFGVNLFGEPIEPAAAAGPVTALNGKSGALAAEFTLPPFSVLDCRQGAWQDRKNAWLSYGIQSEVGRDARAYNIKEWVGEKAYWGSTSEAPPTDVSVFDPVLTELLYRWFCPPGGHVLDPFAGGSVRGIVAGFLGRDYTGIDLRAEQVAANEVQADTIAPPVRPRWIVGDAAAVLADTTNPHTIAPADLVFTCPPYHDLEVYSDHPDDLSAMTYADFVAALERIIDAACTYLKRDRFAAIVVGDVRDKRGNLRNFVSHTIDAFDKAGLDYYNEAILLTRVGTLAMRTPKQFRVSRKMGKTHQNVLVFVKGDPRAATAACVTDVERAENAADPDDEPTPPIECVACGGDHHADACPYLGDDQPF